MNYTKNYHLPQWVKSDRIMMDDFNDAMSAMENGMTAATATANKAVAVASEAKAEAFSRPYVVGSYQETEQVPRINLGFRPSLVFVSGTMETSNDSGQSGFFDMTDGTNFTTRILITDTGFTVNGLIHSAANDKNYPQFNNVYRTYLYIAFR